MQKAATHLILLMLFCFATGALVYWVCTDRPAVEAILRVEHRNGDSANAQDGKWDYERYRHTQESLIKSNFVIAAALRNNEIHPLPILQGRKHPVQWLASLVKTTSAQNSELVGVRINIPSGQSGEAKQWETVLDGIVTAYLTEIVNKERLERVDELRKTRKRYATVFEQLQKSQDELAVLGKQFGVGTAAELKRDLSIRRIERLETTLLELELQLQSDSPTGEDSAPEDNLPNIESTKSQIGFLVEKIDEELSSLENFTGTSGTIAARTLALKALQTDFLNLRETMNDLEEEIDRSLRVTVVQRAASSNVDALR